MNPQREIPFTRQAYEKMGKDVQALTIKRKEILIRLQAAREMGDLSENGAYKAARFELGSTDGELLRLTYLLHVGVVCEHKNTGIVDFGSRVMIDDGVSKRSFTIVSGYESDPAKQKLSVNSPLGKALVGKRAGDKIVVNAPAGATCYMILSID